ETNPDLASFKLEYHTADKPAWMWSTASVQPALLGEGIIRSSDPGPISIRLTMQDRATNVGNDQIEVPAKAVPTLAAAAGQTISVLPPSIPSTSPGIAPLPDPSPGLATPVPVEAAPPRKLVSQELERPTPPRSMPVAPAPYQPPPQPTPQYQAAAQPIWV